MKTITCIDCEEQFDGVTKEDVQNLMLPHYMEHHKEVMAQANDEKKKEWFEEFNTRWEHA